jgi:hypothetical protein
MNPMTAVKRQTTALFITILMNGFSVLAASTATQLVFSTQPANTVVGAAITNVVVQLKDNGKNNVAQSGVSVSLALANGVALGGVINTTTDTNGKAAFTSLIVPQAGNGDILLATSKDLKGAASSTFNVGKGGTTTTLNSSTNFLVYGQSVTFTATVSAAGLPTGTVTFKSGSATLGATALNTNGVATFSTNRLSAAATNQSITAIYAGDKNFTGSTSGNFSQPVGKLGLTVSGIVANSKIYDGTTNATLIVSNATLAGILSGDTVTLVSTAAKGTFAGKTVGNGKTVSVSGLTLAGASAGNYSVIPPTATANITPRSLVATAKGVNKVYDGTANAAVTLTDNRLAGDLFTNGYAAAAFVNKNVGTAILINVNGLFIGGTDAGNYALSNLNTTATGNITPAVLTAAGIIASNKVYDATTTAALNCTKAQLVTVFIGDSVTLNPAAATGVFSDKNAGTGKTVKVSGLAITGTNAGNYLLTQPATTASITPRSLTLTAKGVNKIYDATTNATVTLTDNRLAGDVLTDSYASAAFAGKNVGTNISINVSGLAIAGRDATNYVLTATSTTAAASISKFTLTVSGVVASDKIYDAKTTATLNFSNAALVTVFGGDTVTLATNAAKGVFASKTVGTNKTVSISGLALGGVSSNNYALIQPVTTASIKPCSLVITAKGVNKIYDGTTNASVTLADNRLAGDVLADSYTSAAFINPRAGTNVLINVFGLAITGTDAGNYALSATNTTASANLTPALLTVAAQNLSRPYATTNPILVAVYSGFAVGESLANSDITGAPVLATSARTNSPVGNYPITITSGTLASVNYSFKLANGVLTVTKADTAAQLATTLNPALTNQNVTFAAQVKPLAVSVLPPTGSIQFKNGTNKLGNAISVSSGTANLTVLAAALGQTNAVITAEYSDPAGNFNSSTNSLTQTVVAVVTPPSPSKLSLTPSFGKGVVTAQLSGVANQTYIIQASADLIHWISISTNVADATGAVSLVDSNAVAFPSRFYRAYSP